MGEDFKINTFYDEKGEELEKIIAHFIANMLKSDGIKNEKVRA